MIKGGGRFNFFAQFHFCFTELIDLRDQKKITPKTPQKPIKQLRVTTVHLYLFLGIFEVN